MEQLSERTEGVLPRDAAVSQERLITQFCIIVTMGVAALVTMFFYAFLPLFIRVLALPVILVGSYWAGNRLVAPIMIVRYDEYLNREF